MSTDRINDGGPVHPVRLPIPGALHANDAPVPTELHAGMSLRDYFAANVRDEGDSAGGDYGDEVKAALVGRPCPSLLGEGSLAVLQFEAEFRAKWRYMRADAMVEARQS